MIYATTGPFPPAKINYRLEIDHLLHTASG